MIIVPYYLQLSEDSWHKVLYMFGFNKLNGSGATCVLPWFYECNDISRMKELDGDCGNVKQEKLSW